MDTILDQPGMTVMVVLMAGIQVFSLAAMAAILLMYRAARASQRRFFGELYGVPEDGPTPAPELGRIWSSRPLLVWTYVIGTVVITVVSSLLFLFQPHVL